MFANDQAAARGAGGLQLRREANISMEKETLTITFPAENDEGHVNVKYEFLNLSNNDIDTEVAFPLPPAGAWDNTRVANFRLLVDGKAVPYETDYKAIFKGKDVTGLLQDLKIDLPSYAGYEIGDGSAPGIRSLSPENKRKLRRAGLTDKSDLPLWDLVITFHWSQVFPARAVVHVEHDYQPAQGRTTLSIGQVERAMRHRKVDDINGNYNVLDELCVNTETVRRLREDVSAHHGSDPKYDWESVGVEWIDYILTTAKSWHGPIKDFELIIKTDPKWHFASCFEPSISATSDTTLRLHFNNYIPSKELSIGFLYASY